MADSKKVSELVELPAAFLLPEDLIPIVDLSNPFGPQSKKVTLESISDYINDYIITGGVMSGSFHGTSSIALVAYTSSVSVNATSASHALVADTAKIALSVNGNSISSSWASHSISSSYATFAQTAAVGTATNANTASYVALAESAKTASFLSYTGTNNGTAYNAINAITASNANTASISLFTVSSSISIAATSASYSETAKSASYASYAQVAAVGITTNYQSSASWASSSAASALSDYSLAAKTAATASHLVPQVPKQTSGICYAISQSVGLSQTNDISISTYYNTKTSASIIATGNVIAVYTSSTPLNSTISLKAIDRTSGVTYNLDTIPIYININGAATSGSISIPFSLMGTSVMEEGRHILYVTSSASNTYFSSSRLSRFSVDINDGEFSIVSSEPAQLTTNVTSDLLTFSSSYGGGSANVASASAIVQAGSSSYVTYLNLSGLTDNIKYIWTLNNLTRLESNGNYAFSNIGGVPNSLVTMSVENSSLNKIYDLSNTSVSYLKVNNNSIAELPSLPATMSYINVSSNAGITTLPTIPYGVTRLYCDYLSITTPPSFNNQIISMSFANNYNLTEWLISLPTSLQWFNVSNCSNLASLPTIPSGVIYLNASYCNLPNSEQYVICADLVTNGLNSGSLNLVGNQTTGVDTLGQISTLQSRAWSVSY